MTRIVLDDEQVRALTTATGRVELVDGQGRHVGYVSDGFTPDEIAAAEERTKSDGPWHSTKQVLERLHALDRKP